jgi:hypothetical protein
MKPAPCSGWRARCSPATPRTALVRGKPADLARVPAHKQLINAPAETGLPIGNLTSQFFANVYLNELDQFIKHELKVRHYLRYVDDFVLLHPAPAYLETCRTAIADFLHARLGLRLRDDGRLAPVSNGIDFLGYLVRPHYRLVRRRVIGHLHERLAAHGRRLRRADGSLFLPAGSVDAVQATLASYLGHCRHARVGGLLEELYRRHGWLAHVLATPGEPPRPQRVDRPLAVNGLADQWRYFAERYPGHVLMMQVGNRWECFDVGAAAAANDAIAPSGAPTKPTRHGLPPTVAFPFAAMARLKRTLSRQGRPWCEIAEAGHLPGGLKRRQLVALWPALPNPSPCGTSS